MRRSLVALLFLLLSALPAAAQITIPFPTFVAETTIDPDQVNSNFSTITSQALNRTGGTITGNISVSTNITIDGADISDFLSGAGNLTVPGTSSLTGVVTFGAPVDSLALTNPVLTNYAESVSSAAIVSNELALDLDDGNHFTVDLDADITTLSFANVPSGAAVVSVLFTGDGTARDITWPMSVKFPDAIEPTMTSTDGQVDIVNFYTVDGGTTWYAIVGGQNF